MTVDGLIGGVANGQAAELRGRRGVAFEQGRGDGERVRDVVETLARIVGGEQGGWIDFESQQIAN